MEYFYWFLPGIVLVFVIAGAITSFFEEEIRAGSLLIGIALLILLLLCIPYFLNLDGDLYRLILSGILGAALIVFLAPFRIPIHGNDFNKLRRFHEEDAVLSRRLLKAGTDSYNSYYKRYPERKEEDDGARSNPGLLSDNALFYDPVIFASAEANFALTEHLHSLESEVPAEHLKIVDDVKITSFISDWLKENGAEGVGFTPLKPYHLYSHKGRGKRSGELINLDLSQAIAVTVEMDYNMMKYAPAGPVVMESSEQYLRSGILATRLAIMIKSLGYQAKAHIDGNYEVICPIVAEDAGLGVIGRMGLLMTPRLGPRVRIAVVTTNLPLKYQTRKVNPYPIDFCNRCKKCAMVCPGNAIPKGAAYEINEVRRWKINSEKCYNYWTLSGTDCGRCMIVCPFSHSDNWFHRFIRWGIQNNLLFRIMAVKLDDVFYGRKPESKKLPDRLIFIKDK